MKNLIISLEDDLHNSPPETLKSARRQLDELTDVLILDDWHFDEKTNRWFVKVQIKNTFENIYIPEKSNWFATAEDEYPRGIIKIYPSIENSINVTFPHQANNGRIANNNIWKEGALCLDIAAPFFKKRNLSEPQDTTKLKWHVQRAIEWIRAASRDALQSSTDFFELPQFITVNKSVFAFSEDSISFSLWKEVKSFFGYADIQICKIGNLLYRVTNFYDESEHLIHANRWGEYLTNKESLEHKAIWFLLDQVPVVNCWQAPNTICELVDSLSSQGLDFWGIFKELVPKIRDDKNHLLLFGFPIPKKFGDENQVIFWEALKLPFLSFGEKTLRGFRNNEIGFFLRDKKQILKDSLTLEWLVSQNWSQDEITSRGKMCKNILSKKILVLGAGCIGSSMSELLVRAGVCNLTIMDKDSLEIGNLSRHVLSLNEVGKSKEIGLMNHLNRINPNANVYAISEKLGNSKTQQEILKDYDIILDCTGTNFILELFRYLEIKKSGFFASISIGFHAKQLYLFLTRSGSYDISQFYDLLNKHIRPSEILEMDFPRDGFGCWHPLFPARIDDVWIASSTALKTIENVYLNENISTQSIVFNQNFCDGIFTGYSIKEMLSK